MELPNGVTELECGCVVRFETVENELPDRNGYVMPFVLQASFDRLCPPHSQRIFSVGGVSIGRS